MGIYQELGVKTYINALDTISVFGGSRMPDVVFDAMQQASRDFVLLADFEEKACARIAEMTHNEAAFITAGASAGLLLCTALIMAGPERARLNQLPDTTGMKDEVLVMKAQRTGYDRALRVAGANVKFVDVGVGETDKLRAAVTENTAAIYFFDLKGSWEQSLSFEDTAKVAKEFSLPLVVDAAAQLPPIDNLWRFTQGGADAVCFSGGKGLRGPQGSGLVVGKKWIIEGISMIGAPIHGIGRSSKAGREEIAGLYTALCEYLKPGMVECKVAVIEARGAYIREALDKSGLFTCTRIYPGPTGQSYGYIEAQLLKGEAQTLVDVLRAGDPGVLIGRHGEGQGIMVNPLLLRDDEVDFVIQRMIEEAAKL